MLNVSTGAVSPSGSRWLIFMTVLAVYICMIDWIAISIAIIPMAEDSSWSPTVQGAVMSAFFVGYVTLQIPAEYLSDRFDGKWVLGLGVLFWSLFILLTPSSAALSISVLLAYRFLMGVAEAVTWQSIYSLYSRWVHPDRRASTVGLMDSGIACGSVIALICTPWLISVWSWQGAFYVYAMFVVCSVFFGLRYGRRWLGHDRLTKPTGIPLTPSRPLLRRGQLQIIAMCLHR